MILLDGGMKTSRQGPATRRAYLGVVVEASGNDVGLKAARRDAKTADDIAARVFEDDEPRHPVHLHRYTTGSTIKVDFQHYRCVWSNISSLSLLLER